MSFVLSKIKMIFFSHLYIFIQFHPRSQWHQHNELPSSWFWFFSNKLKHFSKDGKKDYNCKLLFFSNFIMTFSRPFNLEHDIYHKLFTIKRIPFGEILYALPEINLRPL